MSHEYVNAFSTSARLPEKYVGRTPPKEDLHHLYTPSITLTYIVPAPKGVCNQSCPACVITEKSGEPVTGDLLPEHYRDFYQAFLVNGLPVFHILVQGYEPLLPGSFEYTQILLNKNLHYRPLPGGNSPLYGGFYAPKTGFITNGLLLGQRAEDIYYLRPDTIAISIDGGDSEINDKHRGSPRAFERVIGSERKMGQIEMFLKKVDQLNEQPENLGIVYFAHKKLEIASTLHDAETVESLTKLPAEMKRLGITRWAISPLVDEKDGVLTLKHSMKQIVEWGEKLATAARSKGITLRISDEFNTLHSIANELKAVGVRVESLKSPEDIYRFYPDGSYARGKMIAKPHPYPGRNHQWNKRMYRIQYDPNYPTRIFNYNKMYFLYKDLGYKLPLVAAEWNFAKRDIENNPARYIEFYGLDYVREILSENTAYNNAWKAQLADVLTAPQNDNRFQDLCLTI